MLPALHTRLTTPIIDHGVPLSLDALPAPNADDALREQLFQAISAADETAVNVLLSNGPISANAMQRADGHTALMHAVATGHAGIVELLLQSGASVNQPAPYGMTALMMAAHRGNVALAMQLAGKGAEIDAADEDGLAAPMYAAIQGETACACALALVDAGASITLRNHSAENAVELAASWLHTALAQQLPLRAAVQKGNADLVQVLLAAGAKVDRFDAKKRPLC